MNTVVLILHMLVGIALVCVVLMQRSEGGALGMGGGSGSLISGRGAADVLARGTAILGAVFLLTSIALTMLAGGAHRSSVMEAPKAGWLDSLLPAKKPPPAPISAPAPAPPPIAAERPKPEDVVPAPSESLPRAGPLEGPTVATLPPISAAPAKRETPVSAAQPTPTVTRGAPASGAKPLNLAPPSSAKPAAISSSKPAVSAAPAKPARAKGAESAQPAPPPSRAGPDE